MSAALELSMGGATAEQLPTPADPLKKAEAAAEARKLAAGPTPKPGYDTTKYGPFNNWGQTVNYKEVPRPPDYDLSRPTDGVAKMGYLKDGRPWAPYGSTETGKIRTRPQPSMAGRDKNAPPAPGAPPVNRRLAAGDMKPPDEVKNDYAALDELHRRSLEHYEKIRKLHPETTYGPPIHPRDSGSGKLQASDPMFTETELGSMMKYASDKAAKALGDESVKPSNDGIELASRKVAAASRFYGVGGEPKTAATWSAVIVMVFVFGPLLLCAAGKLWDKVSGKKDETAAKTEA